MPINPMAKYPNFCNSPNITNNPIFALKPSKFTFDYFISVPIYFVFDLHRTVFIWRLSLCQSYCRLAYC